MNDMRTSASRVAVAQLGARRHYAVPLAFWREGLLEQFFTDVYLKGIWPPVISCAGRFLPVSGIRRLSGRRHEQLPPEKVTAVWTTRMIGKLRGPATARMDEWMATGEYFCRRILAKGLGRADAVYAFSSAARELLLYCREHGLTGVLDHATAPQGSEMKLVREEQERFPGWVCAETKSSVLEAYSRRQHEEERLASIIICGCSFVKGMLADTGVDRDRIKVVPLGISMPPEMPVVSHGGLNVLFVGSDGLRKGIGYLARAAKLLRSSNIHFRAVGDLGLTSQGMNEIREDIKVLGSVPRSAMREHWAWADVLVLPSVSETFGLVVLEAMASGLAVITTTSTCGPDVVRSGVDGFVVPPRNAEALAEKLDWMASNPALLSDMKRSARSHAGDFTLEKYGRRLAEAVRGGSNA